MIGEGHNKMEMSQMERHKKDTNKIQLTEKDFKICCLCSSLNPLNNTSCFICGWKGLFNDDNEAVKKALHEAEAKYGEMKLDMFTQESVPSTFPKISLIDRFMRFIRELF